MTCQPDSFSLFKSVCCQGEGLLENPALFSGDKPDGLLLALEYLDYATKYPAPLSWVLRHCAKMCKQLLADLSMRETLDKCSSIQDLRTNQCWSSHYRSTHVRCVN